MANRWSRRRRVLKRPPVCRSLTTENEPATWPLILKATLFWQILHDVITESNFAGTVDLARIGTSNEYGVIFVDHLGYTCVLTVFLGFMSSKSTSILEIAGGPAAGTTAGAVNTGWNGQTMWLSDQTTLIFSDPFGIGGIELIVP